MHRNISSSMDAGPDVGGGEGRDWGGSCSTTPDQKKVRTLQEILLGYAINLLLLLLLHRFIV